MKDWRICLQWEQTRSGWAVRAAEMCSFFFPLRVTIGLPSQSLSVFSLPPRLQEWSSEMSGQLKEMTPSLAHCLFQHYKASCPLQLLTLTWARKRLHSEAACIFAEETEWLSGHVYVCRLQLRRLTTNDFLVRQTREKLAISAWMLQRVALTLGDCEMKCDVYLSI